jgi:hypothetical protein
MRKRFSEWISLKKAQKPRSLVLFVILLFNVAFFLLSALFISSFSLSGTERMGFLEAAFCTITMILDAGCIQFVIADIGASSVLMAVICLIIIIVGMISFTGAVIGYVTNYISNFIESANTGKGRLQLSDHVVILNWNNRASEIINDLLYCKERQRVVVLVNDCKAEIEAEIGERLQDTVERENKLIHSHYRGEPFFRRRWLIWKKRFKNNISLVIRQGDVFSSKQLHDISLEYAKTIIVLGNNLPNGQTSTHIGEDGRRGNSHVIKTLMQVADIASAEYSSDNQKIVVEIEDEWTWDLVQKIIEYKQVDGKCNIVPVRVNQILGQLLSQFSLMPELNMAYKELFSNRGAEFYSVAMPKENEIPYFQEYMEKHHHAIPLTFMESGGKSYCYFAASELSDIFWKTAAKASDYSVKLNRSYWIEHKNVIMLGHNSKCADIMAGFSSFCAEWDRSDGGILSITVIDDEDSLEKMGYYQDCPFVAETVAAAIYDKDIICEAIERIISANLGETSILILSDDTATDGDVDASALANLVFVQEIINRRVAEKPSFDPESIDLIVEIIDPKHVDIVHSYSVKNVVISNRYISKMITQIGEKDALFDFYKDILSYDSELDEGAVYESKEVYAKRVDQFFAELPGPCTAAELIQAVYQASVDDSIPDNERYPTIVLGYVPHGKDIVLFSGNQTEQTVELHSNDKLIVFTNH